MQSWITKYATGKKVLLLFVLCNLIYVIMLAFTIPKVMHFTEGMKLLDMMPGGYNFDYVRDLFTALGNKGRHAYLYQQIPIDMVYPALFAIAYCLLLAYFLGKLQKLNRPYIYLCFLPLIGGTADYLENIGIITLLNQYPEISGFTVQLTSVFSLIKSAATSIYFVALLVVLILLGIRWISRKR